MARVEEIASIIRSFGDEQSTLFDSYERHSFEVQLNKAMLLGRSLSEPAVQRRFVPPLHNSVRPSGSGFQNPVKRNGSGFQKMVKKLFSPVLGKKEGRRDSGSGSTKDPIVFWKAFSRSLRV